MLSSGIASFKTASDQRILISVSKQDYFNFLQELDRLFYQNLLVAISF